MKGMKYIIYLFLTFLFKYKIRAEDNRDIEYRCGADDEKFVPITSNRGIPIDPNKKIYRRRMDEIDSDGFKKLNMYIDFENLKEELKENDLENYQELLFSSLLTANETLGKLLKVKPHQKDDWMSDRQINNFGIYYWEKDKFGDEAYENNVTFFSTGIDIAIFGRMSNSQKMGTSTLASAVVTYLEVPNGLPYAGRITINKDYLKEAVNLKLHLEHIFIHEFTHVLGFSSNSLFRFYNNKVFTRIDKNGINRTYINTTKVIEVAKKYYNCSEIDGFPLEEYGGSGTAGSHWESRLLYGEYMTGSVFNVEFIISEFTLALLEDSGNYKANYYTGGLMRFGKNKGCNFLTDNCIDENGYTQFGNEFFDSIYYAYDIDPSCSSGRQGKTYNWLSFDPSVPSYYNYLDEFIGLPMADYCPVSRSKSSEISKNYLAGHCSELGKGANYGDQVYYYMEIDGKDQYVHFDNSKYENITGEIYSDISFCYLSSLIKKSESLSETFSTMVRAICFQTFCSSKSLTVKIFNDYIVCPRNGGKIEVDNYDGYLLCPDYNLICSGTVLCNNALECIDKKSEIKEESYYYDYNIATSQDIEFADICIEDNEYNYELSDDGKCPKYCKICNENRKCLKCKENYVFVGSQKKEEILCKLESELTKGYYKVEDNLYFECINNCLECSDGNSCEECKNGFDLNNNLCVSKILNCEVFKNSKECQKCIENYAFKGDARNECLSKDNFNESFYTKDDGISYYPCSDADQYCLKCFFNKKSSLSNCYECIDQYAVLADSLSACVPAKDYQNNNDFFFVNYTYIEICSKLLTNCQTCNNSTYCNKCLSGHYFLNDKRDRCYYNDELKPEDEIYKDGNNYYTCNNSNFHMIPYCKKCYSKLDCILCDENYTFINGIKYTCVEINSLQNKYFKDPDDESNYIKCSNLIDNCNLCNNTQCLKCDEEYIFIDDNFNNCILKSSINLSLYYTNDEIIYYSCTNEKYKDNPKCKMINQATIIPSIPDIETTIPEIETIIPNIKTTIPDIETTIPDIETTIPKIKTTIPDIETTIPDIETTIPDIETTIPDIETSTQDIETTTPDIETTIPKIKTTVPDIETTIPEIETTIPKIETTTPDIETTIPKIETTTPVIETTIPKIKTTIPDIETTIPDIETTIPKIKTTVPDIETTIQIETTVIKTQKIIAKFDNPYKKPIFFLQAQLKNNSLNKLSHPH